MAAANWFYWLIITRFATTADVGEATTIYSLVLLVSTITQLGLEYPLLRRSVSDRTRTLGTALVLELAITASSIPIILYYVQNVYQESQQFAWIAAGILMFSSSGFVLRFFLLGLSKARVVLLFDLAATAARFASGLVLVGMGYGATGILLSFILQTIVVSAGTLLASRNLSGLGIGKIAIFRTTLREGLVNFPSKLSGMLILSLSVVMLTAYGIDNSQVGVFYIVMMISIIAGSFASSLAFTAIPASSQLKTDLSTGSLRIGLAFTAPIITILLVSPESVLKLIGEEYASGGTILSILAAAILPSAILSNSASRFNNLNQQRNLLAVGVTRIGVFLVSFTALVPAYGTVGAASAILISFTASAAISLLFSGKIHLRYILMAISSIALGVFTGKLILTYIVNDAGMVAIAVATTVCILLILALKCISAKDLSLMLQAVSRGRNA